LTINTNKKRSFARQRFWRVRTFSFVKSRTWYGDSTRNHFRDTQTSWQWPSRMPPRTGCWDSGEVLQKLSWELFYSFTLLVYFVDLNLWNWMYCWQFRQLRNEVSRSCKRHPNNDDPGNIFPERMIVFFWGFHSRRHYITSSTQSQ